jgi:hypothetical protein
MKTCFVSAPSGTVLDILRDSLVAHGMRPLVPEELSTGTDLASEIQRRLVEADLVIGILSAAQPSNNVYFELGQAAALGKRILVIAAPGAESVIAGMHRMLVLRTTPDNREAIDFALDQVAAAPPQPAVMSERKIFVSFGLGAQSDALLSRLDDAIRSSRTYDFERVLFEAIKGSGADVVVEAPERGRGADLVVWSDVLEAFVGNPLLVEAKLRVPTREAARKAFQQLSVYIEASSSRWAVLLYGDGPPPEHAHWRDCPPNVLLLPARGMIETLRGHAFPEVIRDLRNRRVHAVRP